VEKQLNWENAILRVFLCRDLCPESIKLKILPWRCTALAAETGGESSTQQHVPFQDIDVAGSSSAARFPVNPELDGVS
jgi:hypothetical protein